MQEITNFIAVALLPFFALIAGWVSNGLNRKRKLKKEENDQLLENRNIRLKQQEELDMIYEKVRRFQQADMENTNKYLLLKRDFTKISEELNALKLKHNEL